jgi:hypothetical protein
MVGRLNDLSVYWVKELSGSERDSQNIPEEDYPLIKKIALFRNISHDSVDAMTTERMTPSWTNSPPAEIST